MMALCTYFAVFVAILPTVLCCGNVDVVLEKVDTSCSDGAKSLLEISPDFGFTLSDKCILTPSGCAEMTKDAQGAQIKYEIATDVVPLTKGEYDGCDMAKDSSGNQDLEDIMNLFNVPKISSDCTIPANKLCAAGQTLDLSKHSSKLMFTTGRITAKTEAVHDDGSKSCFNIVIKISPKPF